MEKDVVRSEEVEPPSTLPGLRQPHGEKFAVPPEYGNYPKSKKRGHLSILRARETAGFSYSPWIRAFRERFFPNATDAEWNDWRWQLRHRITHLVELDRFLRLSANERNAMIHDSASLPVAITPYFMSLLNEHDASQPLRRTVIPDTGELLRCLGEAEDPLGEEEDSPVPGIVHRYPDRVLFLVTGFCSTYCRYCTRSRLVGSRDRIHFSRNQWQRAIAYIEATPTVRDVLLSGGDPLTLSDGRLEWLVSQLRQIPHVELIRIGTKVPVVLPQRITSSLTRMLRRYHPLWMSIHCTHPDELTSEMRGACERLADAGIPLGSQTVLLAGVNDEVETMRRLFHGLLQTRVRPYYLYQCDPILGSAHFRTPVKKGLDIIRGLRGHTSGYAVPSYVIDAPGGGGKIPLLPDYVIGWDGNEALLKNYEGRIYRYTDCGREAGQKDDARQDALR